MENTSDEAVRNSIEQSKNHGTFDNIRRNISEEMVVAHSEPVDEYTNNQEVTGESILSKDNLNIILTLAEIDEKISISDIQSLFDIGYVKAKEKLEYAKSLGHLKDSQTEDTYDFVSR